MEIVATDIVLLLAPLPLLMCGCCCFNAVDENPRNGKVRDDGTVSEVVVIVDTFDESLLLLLLLLFVMLLLSVVPVGFSDVAARDRFPTVVVEVLLPVVVG